MALKFVDDIDLDNKKVLARFDFNVPLDKKSGEITDTSRIDQSMETIRFILEQKVKKLVLMGHLGRPKGKRKKEESLLPVAKYLADVLNTEVLLTESATDSAIKTLLGLKEPRIILLENLRFHREEEMGDKEFSRKLAAYGDIYINDAFGTCHRRHASIWQINTFFKDRAAGGFLLKREMTALKKLETPERPFMAIMGGAKVSDKIKIIKRLLSSVDFLFIGGAMAYPFLSVKDFSVGDSLCSPQDKRLAQTVLNDPLSKKLILPSDHLIADSPQGKPQTTSDENIPAGKMGLDIGPLTIRNFSEKIRQARTVFWNGPLGLFENKNFSEGTIAMARAMAESQAYTLVGGGDSISAVNQTGLAKNFSHLSTGGGASLEYMEQGTLPGIEALKWGVS
ncbi:MAG: phosphoglycerate kinase [Halobacteriovoraceae bacterium]|nr:phosphoglycerate kinase [Halobacteriovoraceae bacterium]